MIIKKELEKNKIELIPVNDIEITLDETKKTGYDFTIEDNFTFATDDGLFVFDTVAVFHPLSMEVQDEIKQKMTRGVGFSNSKSPMISFSKEMCVGLFIMTKNIQPKESPIAITQKDMDNANNPYIAVNYRNQNTTMGKAIFNSCFPEDFPFYNQVVDKKRINGLIMEVINKYGEEIAFKTFSKLQQIAFKFATIAAPGITLDDLQLPDHILKMKEQLKTATIEQTDLIRKEIQKELQVYLKDSDLGDLISSGSTKGWGQPMQILISKGNIANVNGGLASVTESFADGVNSKDFFNMAAGSRFSIMQKTLKTADTGYLNRILEFLLSSIEVSENIVDCKTKRTIDMRLTKDIIGRIKGRYVIVDGKVELFDEKNFKVGDIIHLRTPIYCQSSKICQTCYGRLIYQLKSRFVGMISSQMLGEPLTQGMLRQFHKGGAIDIKNRDIISDIIQNNPYIKEEK
jgi:hypothetical protein